MPAPDAEAFLATLVRSMRGKVDADTGLVGIHSGGVWVAERLHDALALPRPIGTIDVAFYRDDFERRGLKADVRPSALPFDVEGGDIVLIDDVLFTGRTIRAALNVLFDYGRPARVRLATLVDRGGRELPIAPDFVGGALTVTADDIVVLERAADARLSLAITRSDGAA